MSSIFRDVSLSSEFEQRRRQRQRKRHPKIYLYFICVTSRCTSTRSTFAKMANFPGTKLVGVAYKLRKKMKNSLSSVHVLHKSLNVVISRCCFAEDGKEIVKCKTHVQSDGFCSLNLLFCGVVVAVAVVVA